jgi:hypothetical protein
VIPVGRSFVETSAETRTEADPLSHLSIELGYLSHVDLSGGTERLRHLMARVAPWARAGSDVRLRPKQRPRVSTCLLIDDYHQPYSTPAQVLPPLLAVAAECDPRIDYLVRESACVVSGGAPLADLVAARLTAVPPVGTNGSLDPPEATGWVSNGQRSPTAANGEAMRRTRWAPPEEIGARNHSVFVDVRLQDGDKKWSHSFLAAVRQLLRLGLIRHGGRTVVRPQPLPGTLPESWAGLPAITQLSPAAKPFTAYRTFSILPSHFLQVANAARIILSQVSVNREVLDQIKARAEGENIRIQQQLIDRVSYMLFNE